MLAGLGDDGVAVPAEFADQHDLKVGDELRSIAPRGNEVTYRVEGIYDPGAGVIGGVLVDNASLERDWDAKDIAFALVAGAPGADPGAVKRARRRRWPASRPPSRRRSRTSRTSRTSRSTRSSGSSTRCCRCR